MMQDSNLACKEAAWSSIYVTRELMLLRSSQRQKSGTESPADQFMRAGVGFRSR